MLIKGPFILKWGDYEIHDVEEVDVEYEVDSDDLQTLQGKTFEVDGSHKASAVITLLAGDIPVLSALLPQHHIANGGQMSTGETVNNADGAIDVAPADCDVEPIYNNLDIISCSNPGQVVRIVNARTRLDDFDFDNKIGKIMVKFIGEAEQSDGVVQIFKENTIGVVS